MDWRPAVIVRDADPEMGWQINCPKCGKTVAWYETITSGEKNFVSHRKLRRWLVKLFPKRVHAVRKLSG